MCTFRFLYRWTYYAEIGGINETSGRISIIKDIHRRIR
jgi:hypothetical protein